MLISIITLPFMTPILLMLVTWEQRHSQMEAQQLQDEDDTVKNCTNNRVPLQRI